MCASFRIILHLGAECGLRALRAWHLLNRAVKREAGSGGAAVNVNGGGIVVGDNVACSCMHVAVASYIAGRHIAMYGWHGDGGAPGHHGLKCRSPRLLWAIEVSAAAYFKPLISSLRRGDRSGEGEIVHGCLDGVLAATTGLNL